MIKLVPRTLGRWWQQRLWWVSAEEAVGWTWGQWKGTFTGLCSAKEVWVLSLGKKWGQQGRNDLFVPLFLVRLQVRSLGWNFEKRMISKFIYLSRNTGFFFWAAYIINLSSFFLLIFVLHWLNRRVPFLCYCDQRQMQMNSTCALLCGYLERRLFANKACTRTQIATFGVAWRCTSLKILPCGPPRYPSTFIIGAECGGCGSIHQSRTDQERYKMLTFQKKGGAKRISSPPLPSQFSNLLFL